MSISNMNNHLLVFEQCKKNAPEMAQWILEEVTNFIKTHHGMSFRDFCYSLASVEMVSGEITIGHGEKSVINKIITSSGSVYEAWHDYLTRMIFEPFIRHAETLGHPPINCYTSILSQICNSVFGISSDNMFVSITSIMPEAFKELFNNYPSAEREISFGISDLISNFSQSTGFLFHNLTKILNTPSGFDDYKYDYDYDGHIHLVSSTETSVRESDPSDYGCFNPGSFLLGAAAGSVGILAYKHISNTPLYKYLKSKVCGYLPDICKSNYSDLLATELQSSSNHSESTAALVEQ